MKQTSAGFTLLETLVVAGIIALLIGLLVPAVQYARESANAGLCRDRLRQLGLAAHQYHADHGRLPFGYLGPSLNKETVNPDSFYEGQWIGHFPFLLPYLEAGQVARQIDVPAAVDEVTTYPWFWRSPAQELHEVNLRLATIRFSQFRCPSAEDFPPEVGNPTARGGGTLLGWHVYHNPGIGPQTMAWREEYRRAAAYIYLGSTNFVGVAGCGSGGNPIYARYEGVYTNRSKISLGQISSRDGTSQTLLYGEAAGGSWLSEPWTKNLSWMGAGSLGTYLGSQSARNALTIQFSGFHVGGTHFCFADVSVRRVRYVPGSDDSAPGWTTLQQLGSYQDAERIEPGLLMD